MKMLLKKLTTRILSMSSLLKTSVRHLSAVKDTRKL